MLLGGLRIDSPASAQPAIAIGSFPRANKVRGGTMLEKLFNDDSCQRLLAGPMGPHLEALSSKLAELGYCDSQARKLVCTAAALGHWLADRGLTPAEAGPAELKTYIEAQKRMPSGRLGDGAVGFSRLPTLLKAEGVLCRPSPETPADPCLLRFSAYLANVRGVTRAGMGRARARAGLTAPPATSSSARVVTRSNLPGGTVNSLITAFASVR